MKLAMVAADYTPGEADQLRRDMAAWRKTGRIEKHRARIIERMVAKGIEREFAEGVFEQIRGFGEYGFPESHAASFSLIAYATAWLRAFYPTVFTCALLNAWPMGFYSPASIVSDARRHEITVRPIDVLISEWECTLEPISPGSGSKAHQDAYPRSEDTGRSAEHHRPAFGDGDLAVRMGARFVKGLGTQDWERVRGVRTSSSTWIGSGSTGLARFLRQAHLDTDARIALSRAGAFRSFSEDRRAAVWESLDGTIGEDGAAVSLPAEEGDLPRGEPRTGNPGLPPSLFGADHAGSGYTAGAAAPMDRAEEVAWDYLTSFHSTAAHPLEPYRGWLEERGYPRAGDVRRMEQGARLSVIGMVICRQRPDTAGGTVFMTLEDETGFVNLIIWRSRFEQLRTVLLTGSFLGVRGVVQNAEGVVHVLVEDAWHARLPHHAVASGSRDFH